MNGKREPTSESVVTAGEMAPGARPALGGRAKALPDRKVWAVNPRAADCKKSRRVLRDACALLPRIRFPPKSKLIPGKSATASEDTPIQVLVGGWRPGKNSLSTPPSEFASAGLWFTT